jgi:hypothetical protein
MSRGPEGEKHPADVVGNAVHVMRAATKHYRKKAAAITGTTFS